MLNILQQFMNISEPDQLNALYQENSIQSKMHFFWKSKTGSYLGCSDQLAKNLGFNKASELLGCTDFDLCWASSASHFKLNDDQIIYNKKSHVFIETGKLITGTMGRAISYKSPLRLRTTKKIAGIICICIEFDDGDISLYDDCEFLSKNFLSSFNLTNRQKQCLYYLTKGMSMKQIAMTLKLSPRTVEHYIEAVKSKLGCHSRAQLISKILEQ